MSGQDREGETWEYTLDNPEDCVTTFVVVRSVPRMVPGNWRDRPAWVHTVLALTTVGTTIPEGGMWEVQEDETCEVFTHRFKRIGSLLPETG